MKVGVDGLDRGNLEPPPAAEARSAVVRRAAWSAPWALLALALAFSAFVRWRLADLPLERDEGEYAYAGQLLLRGIPPYNLAYNMKLPGSYLAYAGLMAIFGQTTAGIHLGLLAVNLATIVLVFLLAREWFDSMTGGLAAIAFSILSASSSVLGLAAHATHFVTLFAVAGVWLLWRGIRLDRVRWFLAGGLLLGIAFVMKQQSAFLICFGGLAALLSRGPQRPFLSRRSLSAVLIYAAGAVLPYAAVCLWLWRAGTFNTFWFWTVQFAREYVDQIPLSRAIKEFWDSVLWLIGANWPLWAMAAVGAVAVIRVPGVAGRRPLLFGYLGFAFLSVLPGFYFREHYYIVILPGIAILAGYGSSWLVRVLSGFSRGGSSAPRRREPPRRGRRTAGDTGQQNDPRPVNRRLAGGLAAVIPTAAFLLPVWQQRDCYFFWSPQEACRRIYGLNPFIECYGIADYLKDHSCPDDRVAVLGSEPQIYFLAERISATGFMYTDAIMQSHPYVRALQEQMIDEITSAKPEFLVFVAVPMSWMMHPDSDRHILGWINRFVAAEYHPVGVVDIFPEVIEPKYRWDGAVAGARPSSQFHIRVFRRNR